jgi:hypothetical protein
MIFARLILSIVVVALYKATGIWLSTYAGTQLGILSIDQMGSSNTALADTVAANHLLSSNYGSTISLIVLVAILSAIWIPVLKKAFAQFGNLTTKLAIIPIVAMTTLGSSDDAHAYYAKTDWAEVQNILPNHSAFFIPATGNTKDAQKQFESVGFLEEKKVGAKRIEIPHVKLANSGFGVNYYVPGAVLVILDRTPYVVSWTSAKTEESPENQETCVESQDSVEICFDTSIGANVTEEDASKYLYWFGTDPVDKSLPVEEQKFPSILYGKSLPNVMNTRVFSRIHAAYFKAFSKYPFTDLMVHKADILNEVEAEIKTEYKAMGITIEYIGITSQFRFSDAELQKAITASVTAKYLSQAAAARLQSAEVDRYQTETQIMSWKALPYARWDGKLPDMPHFLLTTDGMLSFFKSLWSPKEPTPVQ